MLYKFCSSHTAIAAAITHYYYYHGGGGGDTDDDKCFTDLASKKDTVQLSLFVVVFSPSLSPLPLPCRVFSLNMGRFSLYFQQVVSSYGYIFHPRGVRNDASVGE